MLEARGARLRAHLGGGHLREAGRILRPHHRHRLGAARLQQVPRHAQILRHHGPRGGTPGAGALSAFGLIFGNKKLAGSLIGGIAETQEMLDYCAEHKIVSDIEIIPIQKVNEAYERMLKSDVRYRFVIDIASLKTA